MEINNSQPNIGMMKRHEEEEDRLSDLPESLLLYILSFLPMKSAAKMRTLARRWRALIAHPLDLDLDLDFNSRPSRKKILKYINFVNQVLRHHQDSNIRKFRCLLICKKMFGSPIDSWIDFAITRKVQELDLYFVPGYYQDPYNLPDSFYEHRSFTSLKLERCNLELHRLKSFSFLKNLSLHSIELEDGPFHELLVACPLLENLSMDSCYGLRHILCIPSSCLQLQHLSICLCDNIRGLEIHAMNLLSLKVDVFIVEDDYIFKISSSVKEVSLHITSSHCSLQSWSLGDPDNILFQIFKDLSDTQVFSLSCLFFQVAALTWELRNFPLYFRKLKHLTIATNRVRWHLHGIAGLLRRSPQLETLIINICTGFELDKFFFTSGDSDYEKEYWKSQESSFHCLVHHLKTININSHIVMDCVLESGKPVEYILKKWETEMKVVKYFLKNAMVLEKMTIQFSMSGMVHDKAAEVLLEIRQKLEQLPRASSHAQLKFL